MFNEHLDKNMMAKAVAKSANKALVLLIAKCKAFGGMPHVGIVKTEYNFTYSENNMCCRQL